MYQMVVIKSRFRSRWHVYRIAPNGKRYWYATFKDRASATAWAMPE
jgi:hypothetical protein